MCILLHNYQVDTGGNLFYPNTGTKFREPYHSNHVIPRLGHGNSSIWSFGSGEPITLTQCHFNIDTHLENCRSSGVIEDI